VDVFLHAYFPYFLSGWQHDVCVFAFYQVKSGVCCQGYKIHEDVFGGTCNYPCRGLKIHTRFLALKHQTPRESTLERLWQTFHVKFQHRYFRKGPGLKCVSLVSCGKLLWMVRHIKKSIKQWLTVGVTNTVRKKGMAQQEVRLLSHQTESLN
jgi:hypothetical protein